MPNLARRMPGPLRSAGNARAIPGAFSRHHGAIPKVSSLPVVN